MSLMNEFISRLKSGKAGIAFKFGLVTATTLVIMLSLASVITLNLQKQSLDNMLHASHQVVDSMTEKQIRANKDSEILKANQLSKLLSQIAPTAIAEFDFSGLWNYTRIVTEDPDISYVAIMNTRGNTLASHGDKQAVAEDGWLETPIVSEDIELGKVILGYNHNRMQQQIAQTRAEAQKNLSEMEQAKEDSLGSLVFSQTALTGLVILLAVVVTLVVARLVTRPLDHAIEIANQIAGGDLSAKITVNSKDETGQLLSAMNAMATNLKQMINQISHTTTQLGSTASQMSTMTELTSSGAIQQQAETNQLANAIVEMSASAREVLANSTEAAHSAERADKDANNGRKVVSESIELMNALALDIDSASEVIKTLEHDSGEIGSVLDVIRGIAEQTNLLALNAAIEAARAGEQGRGFAVVADEVRTLAGRTQKSTQEIHATIERLQKSANDAVKVMNQCKDRADEGVKQAAEAGVSLDAITRVISNISDMNRQIATAAQEQSQVTEEIAKNVTNINQVANQTVESARTTSTSTDELNQLSTGLVSLVSKFRTDNIQNYTRR